MWHLLQLNQGKPGERIEPPGETVSWNSDWNVFWKLLCVGILFVIPLAFYLSSWRSNSEQVYWQTVSAFRLVLIGNTGQGRSSAGNTILGREAFRVDFSLGAVTTECQSWTGPVAATGPTGRAHRNHVTVVDTPGVSTTMALGHHRATTAECVNLAAPGPHAFLLVIRLGVRFTEEERNAIVSWIQENFGVFNVHHGAVHWGRPARGETSGGPTEGQQSTATTNQYLQGQISCLQQQGER
uniref:AIG1-type G domain-containing protein n=1 Tax=Hucho hucho TaxID=62062 RepID=A0A4W5PGZ5_9TELE